jgi:hypothetical protein
MVPRGHIAGLPVKPQNILDGGQAHLEELGHFALRFGTSLASGNNSQAQIH